METLRPLDTRHILNPYAFCFRHRLTFTTAHRDKLFFIFGNRFALTQFQFVKGITMTFQQLRLFDGEITVTGEPAWIIFIVEKTISRRKALRHHFLQMVEHPINCPIAERLLQMTAFNLFNLCQIGNGSRNL